MSTRTAIVAVLVTAAAGGAGLAITNPGGGGSLPSGVTTTEVDGGSDYYSQFSAIAEWDDPDFFPIGIFNEFNISSKAASYKALGINTFVGLYNGPLDGTPDDIAVAQTQGMYAIFNPDTAYIDNSTFKSTYGATAAGWVYGDEAEGQSCAAIAPAWVAAFCTPASGKPDTGSFIDMTNAVHSHDATRPVYNGFTNGYAFNWFLNGTASELAQGSDIIGYDVYPMVDRRSTFGGQLSIGKVWGTYETVALSRGHASNEKPIWPDIETSEVDTFNSTCYRPTAADVKALVWNAISAGARGIVYFNSNFASACASPTMGNGVLLSASFADIATAVDQVNADVTALAPVINADFADGYATHSGSSINMMVKYYEPEDAFYIFATPKADSPGSVTFTLAGAPSTTATVVNESRSITVTAGSFADTFSSGTNTHIYKIPNV